MLRHWILSFLILPMLALPGFGATLSTAYYDISILNHVNAASNVRFVLQLKPNVEKALVRLEPGTDALVANLEFNIEARLPLTRQVRHSWRFRKQIRQAAGTEDGLVRVFQFQIAPGTYDLEIEIHDLHAQRRYFESIRFECQAPLQQFQLSDLELETVKTFGPVALAQPLHGLRIESQPDSLRFSYSLATDVPGFLTARAVLYREQESGTGYTVDVSKWQVQHFRTYLQHSDVLRPQPGPNRYAGGFNLQDALDGTYQIELTIYRADTQVAQTSRSFVLEWPRLREVFADLGQAIRWMKWVASPQERNHLAGIQDADQQQREFISWWRNRVAPGSGDARQAMKNYFSRVFMANETLDGGGEAWQRDQGKTMILYGLPDLKREIPAPGMKLSIWLYRSWNMAFLFKEMDGEMKLVRI